MEILVNELSLHKQYLTENEFIDSLFDTIKLYNALPRQETTILKKSDLWNYHPTEHKTLRDILVLKGNDKITKFKSMLASFINEQPYWDLDPIHNSEDKYVCDQTSETSNNSIAEACERARLILSFKSPIFKDNEICVVKNTDKHFQILNFYLHSTFWEYLISISTEYFIDFCKNRFENYKVDFVKVKDKYPIQNFLDTINDKEKNTIVNAIRKLVLDYLDQEFAPPENISKNLKDGIFEIRIDLKDRICRLLYFYNPNKTIIFTHGFIKKTQTTPPGEISNSQ